MGGLLGGMGSKQRRSTKVASGVKLNKGKKSRSVTVGGKGAKVTTGTAGTRVTVNFLGLSVSKKLKKKK
ncbi:MAG TPA: DUF4236 domain-containing protein [Candidatus Xenobia bacterium]|jgi:hypothetical protein